MKRLSTDKNPNPFLYGLLRLFARAVSAILWRVRYVGSENIPSPDDGAMVVAANHQTYIDPVWISVPIRHRIRFLAWDRAFSWPFIGGLIRYLGAVPVNTASGRSAASWKAAVQTLKSGGAVLIFPEGAREFADGRMLPFKPGAVRMAADCGVPILPVTVRGANNVWPQGQRWPRPGRVEIVFHPLLRFPEPSAGTDRREYFERCEETLREVIVSGQG